MAPIPKTMKGVTIEKTGGVEVLQYKTDLPMPTVKEGQVLVKNELSGINYIDTYFRTGLYPAPSFPYILGRDASGVVQQVGTGETYSLKEGDKVVYMAQSTYAEYTAAPALHVKKLPSDINAETAIAAMLQGLTAITLIREAHPVKSGDWVLVHAAAGGVGLLLVQMLKDIGAKVIATCSKGKIDLVKKYNPELIIDYGNEDFKAKVLEITKGEGVAAVFDGVGKTTFDGSLDCVARKGSMVSFGNASGAVEPFKIARLSAKNAKLLRPTLFGYMATREEFEKYTTELFDFIKKGMEVKVHETYPLKDVAKAHEELEGRKSSGKLLLKI
ncbi:NAD(P)-binding protein [Tothia fuscella]|uniref:Probable quinone oxidoreductase n=1 Tax=Tothia fuscella TaxID=1048955 RepID=A0A9P4TXL0_9PEZI|nr:NAD(P)-binding protein [Tothia fuscella]